ncbi:MAG: hypothetical protein ACFCVD_22490 [Nodosilinea sp.]
MADDFRPRRWRSGLTLAGLSLMTLVLTVVGQIWPLAYGFPLPPVRAPALTEYANVHAYNLGTTTLTQQGVADPFQTMPLPLTGVIALPDGEGPFPLVVVLHGRHEGCHFAPEGQSQWPCAPGTETRFDVGFAALAQGLAEAGYGVLAPNLNAAFSETYGATDETRNDLADQRSPQIIDAHLTRLAEANEGQSIDFGIALAGQIDLSTIAIVGHSMGGGAAALSALSRQPNVSAAALAAGLGPVSALVLVSPTRSQPIEQRPEVYALPDVPSAVLVGGCDRDIFDLSSLYFFETASQAPSRTSLATSVLLLGANHNYFNGAISEDDYYRLADNAPLCNPQQSSQRLSRVAQEAFLSQYVQGFLNAVLKAPEHAEGLVKLGLAPDRAAPGKLFGQPVLTNLAMPANHRYAAFSAAVDPPDHAITDDLILEHCPGGAPCGGRPRPWPKFPAVLRVTWATDAARLRIPLATANMSGFDSLQLRLALDSSAPHSTAGTGLAVLLHDSAGQAVRVDIPPTTPALHQFEPDPAQGYSAVPVYPTALRIPLGQFYGIDLTTLTAVELVFDQAPQGTIYLATVEFVGG